MTATRPSPLRDRLTSGPRIVLAAAMLMWPTLAARRPTVTSALTQLTRRELVRPLDVGWLLRGDPPGELAGELAKVGAERV